MSAVNNKGTFSFENDGTVQNWEKGKYLREGDKPCKVTHAQCRFNIIDEGKRLVSHIEITNEANRVYFRSFKSKLFYDHISEVNVGFTPEQISGKDLYILCGKIDNKEGFQLFLHDPITKILIESSFYS